MNPFAIATGVKTAIDLAKTIKDVVDDAELKAKSIELYDTIISLQGGILSMQAENHSLLQEKNNLEAELMKIEKWEKEKTKYSLVKIGEGVHVFALKKEYESSLPPHYLCPTCYYEEKQSILVAGYISPQGSSFTCPKCKTSFKTNTVQDFSSMNLVDDINDY